MNHQYRDDDNEHYQNQENFQMDNVCSGLHYTIKIGNYKISVMKLLCILIVVAFIYGIYKFHSNNNRYPNLLNMSDDMALLKVQRINNTSGLMGGSPTSSMNDIYHQMGGGVASSLSVTPNFIKNLNYY